MDPLGWIKATAGRKYRSVEPSSPCSYLAEALRSSFLRMNPSSKNPMTTPGIPKLMSNSITFPTPNEVLLESFSPVMSATIDPLPAVIGLSGQNTRGMTARNPSQMVRP